MSRLCDRERVSEWGRVHEKNPLEAEKTSKGLFFLCFFDLVGEVFNDRVFSVVAFEPVDGLLLRERANVLAARGGVAVAYCIFAHRATGSVKKKCAVFGAAKIFGA